MATTVEVREAGLHVGLSGLHKLWALSGDVTLFWDEVTDVRVAPWSEVRPGLGWRVGGTYVPRVVAAGWYTVPGEPGRRQLWSVYRERDRLLVVDTTRERPCRLVLEVDDPGRVAEAARAHRA